MSDTDNPPEWATDYAKRNGEPYPVPIDFIWPCYRMPRDGVIPSPLDCPFTRKTVKWLAEQAGREVSRHELTPDDGDLWITDPCDRSGFLEPWRPWECIGQAMQALWGFSRNRPDVEVQTTFHWDSIFHVRLIFSAGGGRQAQQSGTGQTLSTAICSALINSASPREAETQFLTCCRCGRSETVPVPLTDGSWAMSFDGPVCKDCEATIEVEGGTRES